MDEEKRKYYSNMVNIAMSPFDVTLSFGNRTPKPDKRFKFDEHEVSLECQVIMSPIQAKAFLEALSKAIETYEKTFGKLELKGKQKEPMVGFTAEERLGSEKP